MQTEISNRPIKTYTYGQIWHIAFPILISTLMEQLIGMADAAFLGHVDEIELGASALGGIFYISIFMLGLGFSIGAQILIGRRNGEGNYSRIGSIFYHGTAFLLLLSVILFLATRTFAPSILEWVISSPEVCRATETYIYFRVPGFFFACTNAMFRAFYVGTTNTRTLTANSVTMVLSNVVFNYLLIFGKCGLPELGIAGAAIGSTMAEAVSTTFFIIYTRCRIDFAKYGLNRLPRIRLSMLGEVMSVSVWVMVQNFLSLSTWFLFFIAIEHIGPEQLAATNIVRNISSFTFMTCIALGSTASTLASNLIGSGDTKAVMPMINRTIRLSFFVLVPLLALLAIFPSTVASIFTNDASLISTARPVIYALVSSYIMIIPAEIYFHAVSGTGNTRTAFIVESLSLVLYTIYVCVVVLQLKAPLWLCWTCEHVYYVIMLSLSFLYMRSGRWIGKKI